MSLPLTTERLLLRMAVPEDAAAIAAARSTPFVLRYNLYRPCDAAQICSELEYHEHILLTLRDTGRIIGAIVAREDELRYHVDSLELHAWLTEEFAHRGYMQEALTPVIQMLFDERRAERLALRILADNTASLRLAEKLGFQREGYLPRAVRNAAGEIFDLALYSLASPHA